MNRFIDEHLVLRAGDAARARIAANGVRPQDFGSLLGASGGPKWLILAGLDRYLAGTFFRDRQQPLALLGTSIGCWRHAIYPQRQPLAALDRFLAAYLAQRYSARPTSAEVTRAVEQLLDTLLGSDGAAAIAGHTVLRSHVLAVRCHGPIASESRPLLMGGLALAAALNLVSRRTLALSFTRALFGPAGGSDFRLAGLPALEVALAPGNVRDALLATAAVPLVFAPRRDIAGAPPGVYRDGGITDYHFDLHMQAPAGLVLFPHFYDRLVPGWFDKALPWRRADGALRARTLLVAPSPALVAALPARHIPDRRDFARYDDASRERQWRSAVDASERMGEALAAWVADPDPARYLQPL